MELPHGYTVDDVAGIARYTARAARGAVVDDEELRDIAGVACVELLCAAEEPPALSELYRVAHRAVGAANRQEMSFAGLDRDAAGKAERVTPPRWAAYWRGARALEAPWEEQLVDEIAVRQVMAALPARHQVVLRALATEGSYAGAMAMLGIPETTWRMRIGRARAEARALWHAPEPPSKHWAIDFTGLEPDSRGHNRGLSTIAQRRRVRQKNTPAA